MQLNPKRLYAVEKQQVLDQLIHRINFESLGKRGDSYDILHVATAQAALESALYYSEKMSKAKNFAGDFALLERAMEIRIPGGQILEFGVASGRTINHLSSLTNENIFGFDVFTGLPEDWRTGFPAGEFAQTSLPRVNENVELIVGLFDETLDVHLEKYNSPISLIHVDCDLYAGTKTIFNKLGHLVRSGTVIVFDEYFNYPGWRHHEFKAFQEFVEERKIRYHYDAFVSKHQQVCVVID